MSKAVLHDDVKTVHLVGHEAGNLQRVAVIKQHIGSCALFDDNQFGRAIGVSGAHKLEQFIFGRGRLLEHIKGRVELRPHLELQQHRVGHFKCRIGAKADLDAVLIGPGHSLMISTSINWALRRFGLT